MGHHSETERRALLGGHSLVLWVLVFAMIAALLWAARYRLDQTVRGAGTVISSSRIQVIQSVDGGVLASLRVKEGDRVAAGQVLAVLE